MLAKVATGQEAAATQVVPVKKEVLAPEVVQALQTARLLQILHLPSHSVHVRGTVAELKEPSGQVLTQVAAGGLGEYSRKGVLQRVHLPTPVQVRQLATPQLVQV